MNKRKKFAIIANCQAGPLANIIKLMSDDLELVPVAAVHTLDKSNPELLLGVLRDVDVIIHQPIGDSFGPLSIDRIKEVLPHKSYISFPSIYFDGYFPNLMYLRKPEGGTLSGLIGDYHDRRLVEASLKGMVPQEAVEYISSSESKYDVLSEMERSLNTLQGRERHLDVRVSSYIRERVFEKRLFYVFNHPTNEILIEVAKQVLSKLNIELKASALQKVQSVRDYLSSYQVALDTGFVKHMLAYEPNMSLYATRQGEREKSYTLLEFCTKQLALYEKERELNSLLEFADERKRVIGY